MITGEGVARIGDFGITAIITDPTVVERSTATTSKLGITRYMAPELLNPQAFGLTHSNPSKESDVYSFGMTTYEVFSCLVARITDERLLPMARSSRETCHMADPQRLLPLSILHRATGHLAQITRRPTVGSLIKSGTSFNSVGSRLRGTDSPFIHCINNSSNLDRNKGSTP